MGAHMEQRRSLAAALQVGAIVAVVLTTALLIFVWPAARLEPRDLPIGLVGTPEQAAAFGQQIAAGEGTLEITRFPDEASAIDAIESRDIYGAVILSGDGVRALIASAASPAVSQMLQSIAMQAGPTPVTDVVPGTPDDPRATAFAAGLFPVMIAGLLTGLLSVRLVGGLLRQVAAVTTASLLAGIVAALFVQTWLGLLGGSWWLNAAVYALAVFAIGATVAGLTAFWDLPGAALGVFLMIFLGNAWSGMTSAPELLPSPLGTIGQWLPPGAAGNLLRSTAFFDGSGAGLSLTVLMIWAATGIVILATGTLRRQDSGVAVDLRAGHA